VPEPRGADGIQALDPALDAALRKVLQIVHREHPLTANQLLVLASELERLGLHRLVEEHLGRRGIHEPLAP
jgi:hypothetical protein